MKKIFQIFARDMRRLFTNPAAAIVMVGVCVLPSLYAWFNIAANMDPYGNTSNIKVAIANCDAGASRETMSLDAGGTIVDTLKKNNLDVIPEYVVETDQTEREGYEAMEKLLKSEDCPTGIYCANDITAVGILKYLRKCRNLYFTPSIIASDDIEEAQFTKPMLTTVGLPKEEMGRFALYLLLDRMKGGHSGVVRMELSGKLLVRNSCSHVSESFWSDYCI